eukprot:TRINITY_DN8035_c0_g1_i1.p1 TRINITY_DN8035_c0_g1~~TRINITY_DN8035_c0_g1_i1.p1  ORF type:complete len:627 (+),score=144.11 TRINITY_DN8035_c0_g1_i1:103-1881(+)
MPEPVQDENIVERGAEEVEEEILEMESKWLDCCQRCLPCDIDDLLAYRMPQHVYLQHRMLGFTQMALMLAITVYIVVYEVYWQKGWMLPQHPTGTASLEANRMSWNPLPDNPATQFSTYCCDPNGLTTGRACPTGWSTAAGLSAGSRGELPCIGMDDGVVEPPHLADRSIFLATRVTVKTYSGVDPACELNVNNNCSSARAGRTTTTRDYYVTDPESLTLSLQLTAYASRMPNMRQNSGNVRGDDMVAADLLNHRSDHFMNFCSADVDDFQNSLIPANWRRGSETDASGTCDDNEERRVRYGDSFSLSQLLRAVQLGASGFGCADLLDCVNKDSEAASQDKLRFDGAVILMSVIWAPSNKRGAQGALRYRILPKWIRGAQWPNKYVRSEWNTVGTLAQETEYNYHGIRIQVEHTGYVGSFSFVEVLKTTIAGFALFALITFFIERVFMFIPCLWRGAEAVMLRVAYVYSHDFSEIIWKDSSTPGEPPEAHLPLAEKDGELQTRKMRDKDFVYGDCHGRYLSKGKSAHILCFRKAPEFTEDGREFHPDSDDDRYELYELAKRRASRADMRKGSLREQRQAPPEAMAHPPNPEV